MVTFPPPRMIAWIAPGDKWTLGVCHVSEEWTLGVCHVSKMDSWVRSQGFILQIRFTVDKEISMNRAICFTVNPFFFSVRT